MFRLSPPATGALALVLASTLVYVAGITAASATPSSSPDAGPVIVQGVLFDIDGSPAGAGEIVTLTAWPTSQVLAGLAKGDAVPTLTAGVAITDASGAFALRYSDPAALAPFVDTDGTVDFTLDSESEGVTHSYSLSRTVSTSATTRVRQFAALVAVNTEVVDLRPVPGFTPPATVAARMAPDSSVVAQTIPTAVGPPCTWFVVSNLGKRWVRVGAATTTTGVTAKFVYSSGGTSTIGVGVSVSGKKGTFSASGTTTVTSSASIRMAPVTGVASKVFRTMFVFKKFAYRCTAGIGDVKYEVRATSFAGGTSSLTTTTPTARHCTDYEANSDFDTIATNATAETWSAGASLASDIGINLSSQSGFTSSVALRFHFAKAGRLCGTNADPPQAARLVAKK
jgi:hypothetical protein